MCVCVCVCACACVCVNMQVLTAGDRLLVRRWREVSWDVRFSFIDATKYNYYVAQVDMGDNSESSPSSHIVVKVSENGTTDVPKDSSVHMKQGDGSKSNATEQSSFISQVSKSCHDTI